MGKHVVLTCELDGDIDSAENRVVTANVCGHRVELCKKHRVMLLVMVGVRDDHAVAYCDRYDQQAGTKGTNPSMSQVVEKLAALGDEGQAPAEPAQEAPEELVAEGLTEETEVEPAGPKRRR